MPRCPPAPRDERAAECQDREEHAGKRLGEPMRVIGNGAGEAEFRRAGRALEDAPIATRRPFKHALPRLIERLDDVETKILPLRQGRSLGYGARLVRRRRPRPLAHAACARPAELTDHDLLARDSGGHFLADGGDVGGGELRRNWKVLPIGQDMDGDEIDCVLHVGITQPILPDVSVGDRLRHLRLYLADGGDEVGNRHFPAEQHFIADNHPGNNVGIRLGQRDAGRDLFAVLLRLVGQPESKQDLEPVPAGCRNHLIDALRGRVGADTIGVVRQQGEIFIDLPRLDPRSLDQRTLSIAKRCVRQAGQFVAAGKRRQRKYRGRTEPPPHGTDCQRRQGKQRRRRANRISFCRERHALALSLTARSAKIGRATRRCALDKRPDFGCCQAGCARGVDAAIAAQFQWPKEHPSYRPVRAQ